MKQALEGIYHDGQITFKEPVKVKDNANVIVLFLDDVKMNVGNKKSISKHQYETLLKSLPKLNLSTKNYKFNRDEANER